MQYSVKKDYENRLNVISAPKKSDCSHLLSYVEILFGDPDMKGRGEEIDEMNRNDI